MSEQLTFDLPVRPALGRGDFFVSEANAIAVATLENWGDWPAQKMLLIGEAGAGKTHLAHVWAGESGATVTTAAALPDTNIATLATGHIVVEDSDRIAGNAPGEQALFHLHNLVLENGHSLLLTARSAPNLWPIALPDLASRMQGSATITLQQPDDALLSAVMLKLFADRQLQITPRLIPYLMRRIDRSFAAVQETVARLDRAALVDRHPITPIYAGRVLDNPDPDSA